MNNRILLYMVALLILSPMATLRPQQAPQQNTILITNANVFDGRSESLATGMSVLIEGNKITKIGKDIKAPKGANVIDANGRTMTPGFIAAHEHLMLQMLYGEGFTSDERYNAYVATQTANTRVPDEGIRWSGFRRVPRR